jgi:hypothetical protein
METGRATDPQGKEFAVACDGWIAGKNERHHRESMTPTIGDLFPIRGRNRNRDPGI